MNAITRPQQLKNNDTTETESLFELLVDMLGDVDELIGATSAEVREGVIYYMGEGQQSVMSPNEIARRVIEAPHTRHLVWTKGMSAWCSWSKLPVVVDALKELVRVEAPKVEIKRASIAQAQPEEPKSVTCRTEEPVAVEVHRPQPQPEAPVQFTSNSVPANSAHRVTVSAPVQHQAPSSQPPQALPAEVVSLHMDLSNPRGVQFYTGFHGVLSDGGLFVETGMKLEVGQRVELTIELGSGKPPMLAQGLVAWSRSKTEHEDRLSCGVGVHLTSPPEALSTLQTLFNPKTAIFYAA